MRIPCDIILELLEAKLDESLSYLEEHNPRLARQEIALIKTFGSYEAFLEESKNEQRQSPTLP